jgi:flagellar biosynthesis/type III secretory pathway M-ring protein FliF/YscJ
LYKPQLNKKTMAETNILTQARSFVNKLNSNQKWILGGVAALTFAGIIALIVTL